ncbi:MAG: hypothetical protein ABIQ31_24720 [Ferruginibacter sp.]
MPNYNNGIQAINPRVLLLKINTKLLFCCLAFSAASFAQAPPKPSGVLPSARQLATEGTRNDKFWMPAECDVPLRPGKKVKWLQAASGEFSDIKSNPIMQEILLKEPVTARYFKLSVLHVISGNGISVAELGNRIK